MLLHFEECSSLTGIVFRYFSKAYWNFSKKLRFKIHRQFIENRYTKNKKEFLITSFIIWGHGSRSKWGPTIRFSDIIWRPIYKSLSILTWLLNTIRIVHSRYFWIDIISNTSSNWWYWISFGIRLPSYVRIIFLRK